MRSRRAPPAQGLVAAAMGRRQMLLLGLVAAGLLLISGRQVAAHPSGPLAQDTLKGAAPPQQKQRAAPAALQSVTGRVASAAGGLSQQLMLSLSGAADMAPPLPAPYDDPDNDDGYDTEEEGAGGLTLLMPLRMSMAVGSPASGRAAPMTFTAATSAAAFRTMANNAAAAAAKHAAAAAQQERAAFGGAGAGKAGQQHAHSMRDGAQEAASSRVRGEREAAAELQGLASDLSAMAAREEVRTRRVRSPLWVATAVDGRGCCALAQQVRAVNKSDSTPSRTSPPGRRRRRRRFRAGGRRGARNAGRDAQRGAPAGGHVSGLLCLKELLLSQKRARGIRLLCLNCTDLGSDVPTESGQQS
jgi:hypothetical protein